MAISGKLQADFGSFLDAVAQANLKLVDMGKGASSVETKLNNMVANFSGRKVVQEALAMTTALEAAGGSSKLTTAELEKVGAKAAEAAEKMRKLGYEVPPGIQKLADETAHLREVNESAGISVTKLVESYLSAQAILAGLRTAYDFVVGGIQNSIKAAADAEKSHAQLLAALQAQGTNVPSVVDAFGRYATQLQRTTIYQDDAIESAEQLLVVVGNVMPRDMEKALKATTDLASGLGLDLTQAAQLVAKAAEGNTSALRRSGIVLDETKAKAEGFGYVLDEIEKKFGGQAEALAGTYSGRLQQLGNTWNNVEESIGRVITQNATVLKAFDLLNQEIDQQTGELKDNATATTIVSDAVILMAKAFQLFLETLDAGQTGATGFITLINRMGQAVGNVAILALQAARGVGLATGSFAIAGTAQQGIDALADAVKRLGENNLYLTTASNQVGNQLQAIAGRAGALTKELEATRGQVVALGETGGGGTGSPWSRLTEGVDKAKEKTLEFETTVGLLDGAWGRAADGITVAGDHINTVIPVFTNLARGLDGLAAGDGALTRAFEGMKNLDAAVLPLATATIPALYSSLRQSQTALESWLNVLDEGLADLPKLIQQGLTGGGGFGGALQAFTSKLGSGLFAAGGPLNALGNSLTKSAFGISETFGNALGAALPGIGSLIGPALQGIGKLFGKLFDDPEKRINPLRQQFVDLAGGLGPLNEKAHAAGLTLDRLLGARNEAQLKGAIDELTKAFDAQKARIAADNTELGKLLTALQGFGGNIPASMQPTIQSLIDMGKVTGDNIDLFKRLSGGTEVDFKTMSGIAQKYGLDLKALGPAFENARLHDLAGSIVNDFDTMARGLGSVDDALTVLKKPINDLVNDSLKAGIAIPANFRPWVEQLQKTHQLVDENGDELVDLSALKFADPITTEFEKILKKLQELIDKIGKVPDVTIDVGYNYEPFNPPIPGDYSQQVEPIRAATGFSGRVTQPTLFLAGEGGPEDVTIGQPGASTAALAAELRALREDFRNFPRSIVAAFQLAT